VRVTHVKDVQAPVFDALHAVLAERLKAAGVSVSHPGLLDGVELREAPSLHAGGASIS
jgi:hypothetical protein